MKISAGGITIEIERGDDPAQAHSSGVDQYTVTDATVLPDEPGWIA